MAIILHAASAKLSERCVQPIKEGIKGGSDRWYQEWTVQDCIKTYSKYQKSLKMNGKCFWNAVYNIY